MSGPAPTSQPAIWPCVPWRPRLAAKEKPWAPPSAPGCAEPFVKGVPRQPRRKALPLAEPAWAAARGAVGGSWQKSGHRSPAVPPPRPPPSLAASLCLAVMELSFVPGQEDGWPYKCKPAPSETTPPYPHTPADPGARHREDLRFVPDTRLSQDSPQLLLSILPLWPLSGGK